MRHPSARINYKIVRALETGAPGLEKQANGW
jgi:hypothetical protein